MDPQYGETSTSVGAVFDASQYAFFGNDAGEGVELGGLEDDEIDAPVAHFEDEEFIFHRQERRNGEDLRSTSDIDDISGSLYKLNSISKTADTGFLSDRVSREDSSALEQLQGDDRSNWYNQQVDDDTQYGKRWSSQPYSSPHFTDSNSLYRTSSYPDQQPQHPTNHPYITDPALIPNVSYPSHPTPGGQNILNPPYNPPTRQMALSPPALLPFSTPQFQFNGQPFASIHQGGPFPSSNNARPPSQWINRPGLYHQNGLVPSHMLPQMQPRLRPHLLNPQDILGISDARDQKLKPGFKYKNNHYQGFESNGQRYESNWPQFWSRYMTVDEIDNIVRIQLAATHTSDPYVEDYYYQAYLAKRYSGAKLKHHFCPTHLRDSHPRSRTNNEPHAFLQVDGLGRVPFSSIRRPRPLLEVDSPNPSEVVPDQKLFQKPLEQEPMLAVRVIIEESLCILLDVDDVDRFLEFNQLPDGGIQLRQRRNSLLEEVTAALQLVDPLSRDDHAVGLSPKDDFIFLRTVSIPKGRKLLAKYLRLISPGDDLIRVVCMAIFRHLRFLFGTVPSDSEAAESATILASIVSQSVCRMDLGSLSACLAAVVCSSKQPPLRPLGSPSGFGASLILLSVLERASELMNVLPDNSSNYNVANHSLWKASFNEYFDLLIKYCINKYDSIMHSSLHNPAEAIKGELPLELLRASLPHTNDLQRKMLLDLSQRSIVEA